MEHRVYKVVFVVAAITATVMPVTSQTPPAQKPSFVPVTVKTAAYGQSVKKLITYASSARFSDCGRVRLGGHGSVGYSVGKRMRENAPPPPIADRTPPGP